MKLSTWLRGSLAPAAMSIEPTRTIPWIEFAPDISGVCSNGDTRLITSNPMNAASMKTYRLVSRSVFKLTSKFLDQ